MKFGALMAILTFCAGAAFTLVDIGTDASLAYEYWNNSEMVRGLLQSNGLPTEVNAVFAILTTVWIGLGGLIQFLLVAFFLLRDDARLSWLHKSIRILLLLCSPILLGPVIVNLYGAIFVIRNIDNNNEIQTQDDITRFDIAFFLQTSDFIYKSFLDRLVILPCNSLGSDSLTEHSMAKLLLSS